METDSDEDHALEAILSLEEGQSDPNGIFPIFKTVLKILNYVKEIIRKS